MTYRPECEECRTFAEALATGYEPVGHGGYVDPLDPDHDPFCGNRLRLQVAGGRGTDG